MRYTSSICVPLMLLAQAQAQTQAENSPEITLPEGQEFVVGSIILDKSDVFDLSNPEENNALYRLANRLHIITKDKVIRKQLLFQSGDAYSARLVGESERILRNNRYLYDAEITATRLEDGVVDLTVATRDVWSLGPDLSASRSGGENRTQIGLEETNLLGSGQTIRFNHEKDVDRTSDMFEFYDKHIGSSWVSTFLRISDNSDGKSNMLSAIRPFYALDSRWSAGTWAIDDDRRSALYVAGEEAAEYQHARRNFSLFGGWSKGLQKGRAKRWTVGITHDEDTFSTVQDPSLPALIPENRKLVYAFTGFEIVEDEFETAKNHDQIGRTEDFMMGFHLSAMLGWSDTSLGADRDALIYRGNVSRGFGSLDKKALLVSALLSGRLESGHSKNSKIGLKANYYRKQSAKRLFFATLTATHGHELDLDNPVRIGGDSGLRGYPLRYQNGDSKLLLTLEQRYFTDWYPFRLARIGGAVFADIGRAWGQNPVGAESRDWLADIGFGLRVAPTRGSSGKMVHIDIAFPLNGDDTIDSVQILLEAKRSF